MGWCDPMNVSLVSEFVEIEPGFFIEKKQYLNLLNVGLLPWEIGPYLRNETRLRKMISQSGKPLAFQEKIADDSFSDRKEDAHNE